MATCLRPIPPEVSNAPLCSSACPSDDLPRKKSPQMYKPPTPEMLAYLDFSVSTTGILAGVKVRRCNSLLLVLCPSHPASVLQHLPTFPQIKKVNSLVFFFPSVGNGPFVMSQSVPRQATTLPVHPSSACSPFNTVRVQLIISLEDFFCWKL